MYLYYMKRSIGGATSGKRKGPKSKPKSHNKHKKRPKKGRYTISQPKKKRYTVHMPRIFKRKPRSSFQSMSFNDASSYSNIRGKQDFKRRAMGRRNMDGKLSGLDLEQDNDKIRIQRFP